MEDVPVPADVGAFADASSPVYMVPNSPGLNDMVEQNPSKDDINRVRPSFDLMLLATTTTTTTTETAML